MRVRKKFLQLTSKTYPYGKEDELLNYLPKGYEIDSCGNYYYIIGENPNSMFTCHLDTCCAEQNIVNHKFSNNIISTDGNTILGADDKAGMVVILYMIEKKVPGLYYFFIGEEVGCIGSSGISMDWNFPNINKVISFDRKGTDSIITHQFYGRCCSDKFAYALSSEFSDTGLDMFPDDTGIMTDSAQFMDIIPECTNISVGYYNEHTTREKQDIEFLSNLCRSVVKINWESLPIDRDPRYDDDMFEDEEDELELLRGSRFFSTIRNTYSDEYYSYFNISGEIKKMYIAIARIDEEKKIIHDWMIKQDIFYGLTKINFNWNGNSLNYENDKGITEFVGNRTDLVLMISELDGIYTHHLSEKLS